MGQTIRAHDQNYKMSVILSPLSNCWPIRAGIPSVRFNSSSTSTVLEAACTMHVQTGIRAQTKVTSAQAESEEYRQNDRFISLSQYQMTKRALFQQRNETRPAQRPIDIERPTWKSNLVRLCPLCRAANNTRNKTMT